ncbi:MAG: hypothetical protein AB1640_12745 [bacterium]
MRILRPIGVLCAFLWLAGAPLAGFAEQDDYVARKGLELYQKDLQNLVQQIQGLGASDRAQREFLDRLFQLKYAETERLFDTMAPGSAISRQASELCSLKAVEQHALGNWIQAYFALKDAERWNRDIRSQSLKIGSRIIDLASFWAEVEQVMLENGGDVRFLIRPFPQDRMFRPDAVSLTRVETMSTPQPQRPTRPSRASRASSFAALESDVSTTVGVSANRSAEANVVSGRDSEFLSDRLRKALYNYFYDPVESNSDFSLYLPNGTYAIRDKEFALYPVEFEVSGEETRVVLKPARWFRLSFSSEVHPSEIAVSVDGVQWADLAHVPFGKCRVEVKNKDYTYAFVKVMFVPEGEAGDPAAAEQGPGAVNTITVEDRGTCKLTLKERDGNEKFRYSLLGY